MKKKLLLVLMMTVLIILVNCKLGVFAATTNVYVYGDVGKMTSTHNYANKTIL